MGIGVEASTSSFVFFCFLFLSFFLSSWSLVFLCHDSMSCQAIPTPESLKRLEILRFGLVVWDIVPKYPDYYILCLSVLHSIENFTH